MLRSAGDSDRRSKHFFAPTLCFFPLIDGQTRVIRLQVIEGPNARDQVALDSYIKSHRP